MIQPKLIKNTGEYFWTLHAQYKMRQYGLSEQKIRGVLRKPYRKEEGIVKNTIAVMQPVSVKIKNGKKIWKQEIWCMFQKPNKKKLKTSLGNKIIFANKEPSPAPTLRVGVDLSRRARRMPNESTKYQIQNTKYKIISAWRYPGVSPKNNPIPEDILREISQLE